MSNLATQLQDKLYKQRILSKMTTDNGYSTITESDIVFTNTNVR